MKRRGVISTRLEKSSNSKKAARGGSAFRRLACALLPSFGREHLRLTVRLTLRPMRSIWLDVSSG